MTYADNKKYKNIDHMTDEEMDEHYDIEEWARDEAESYVYSEEFKNFMEKDYSLEDALRIFAMPTCVLRDDRNVMSNVVLSKDIKLHISFFIEEIIKTLDKDKIYNAQQKLRSLQYKIYHCKEGK